MVRIEAITYLSQGDSNRFLYGYFINKGGEAIPYPLFNHLIRDFMIHNPLMIDIREQIIKDYLEELEIDILRDKNGKIIKVG